MTAPFNRIATHRLTPSRPAPNRAPLVALVLAGMAAAALGLPVLADASGDGSIVYSPGQPPATARSESRLASDAAAPLRCEVVLDAVGGGTAISGTVHSDHPVTGQYQMAITSRSAGGSATIRQSGAFEAGPGRPAILGETRLMGSPARQEVDLTVTVAGDRLRCGTAAL
jgi:hypothetical protein